MKSNKAIVSITLIVQNLLRRYDGYLYERKKHLQRKCSIGYAIQPFFVSRICEIRLPSFCVCKSFQIVSRTCKCVRMQYKWITMPVQIRYIACINFNIRKAVIVYLLDTVSRIMMICLQYYEKRKRINPQSE